jgi:hypothetical protein
MHVYVMLDDLGKKNRYTTEKYYKNDASFLKMLHTQKNVTFRKKCTIQGNLLYH